MACCGLIVTYRDLPTSAQLLVSWDAAVQTSLSLNLNQQG